MKTSSSLNEICHLNNINVANEHTCMRKHTHTHTEVWYETFLSRRPNT